MFSKIEKFFTNDLLPANNPMTKLAKSYIKLTRTYYNQINAYAKEVYGSLKLQMEKYEKEKENNEQINKIKKKTKSKISDVDKNTKASQLRSLQQVKTPISTTATDITPVDTQTHINLAE